MANPWVWGPAPVFLGYQNCPAASCQFLGWTQSEGPQIDITPSYEGVDVTLAGSRDPMDESYQGQSGTVQLALTRWNEPLGTSLLDFVGLGGVLFGAVPAAAPGVDGGLEAGTLMQTEGANLTLMILAPQTTKAFYALQLPGMRFPNVRVMSARMGPLGTKPRILSVGFQARRLFNPAGGSGSTVAPWTFTLWDAAVSGASYNNGGV